jgi:hypothetical protein
MSNFWQDLRYGIRLLGKSPGFTTIAILTLAIGIGTNTATFSVVNAVLLRPLAYREPNRIVTIASLWKETGQHGQVSAPDFHDWHDQATSFASMAYYEDEDCAVASSSGGQYSHCARVTPEFLGHGRGPSDVPDLSRTHPSLELNFGIAKLDARAHKRALANGWTAERRANGKTQFSQKHKTRRQITYSHCRSLILSSPRFIAAISSHS